MSAYWNAVQACVWIATRDEREVGVIQTGDTLFVTDDVVSNRSLRDASYHQVMTATVAGEPVELTVWNARLLLAEACGLGAVVMLGRKRAKGDLEAIPAIAWGHLEIRDHDRFGVVAASPDMFDGEALWWDELRVSSAGIQRQWPLPRRRRSAIAHEWGHGRDDRPDSVGEAAWHKRRWRLVKHVQPTSLELGPDGLPNSVEVTLVDAWSWLAFGKAIPHTSWMEDAQLADAELELDAARKAVALSLRSFRQARADLARLEEGAPSPTSPAYTVGVVYRAAAMSAQQANERMQDALKKFSNLVSAWLLIQATFKEIHERRGLTVSDQGLLNSLSQEAEQALLHAFLSGDLVCLGRSRSDGAGWKPLPLDCFRWPVSIRVNHNILEPAPGASVDDHRAIAEYVSTWGDLRVNKAALLSWHSARLAAHAPLLATETQQAVKRGRRRKWDWDSAMAHYAAHLASDPDGLPDIQADAERWVADWFAKRSNGDSPPITEIRQRVIQPIYAASRAVGNSKRA